MGMEGSSKLIRRKLRQHATSSRLRRARPPESAPPTSTPQPDPWCDGGGGHLVSAPSWLDDGLPSRTATGPAFHLIVSCKGELLERRKFDQPLVQIGRSPSCELSLNHPTVSRFHAVIERGPGERWVIRDLRSCNGLKVNGSRMDARELRDRDLIRLGDIQLEVELPGAQREVSSEAAEAAEFGRTLVVPPQQPNQTAARRAPRAYLSAARGLSKGGVRVVQLVVDADTFVIGADPGVNLTIEGRLVPRVVAMLVRTARGFSLDPVVGWPWGPKLNGRRIDGLEPLEDGDVIALPGKELTFRLGLPQNTSSSSQA